MRRGTPTVWSLVGLALFVSWCLGPPLLLPWLSGVGVSPAAGTLDSGARWVTGVGGCLGSPAPWTLLASGLVVALVVAGARAGARFATRRSDELVAHAQAAAALGLRGEHTLGPWSATRDGLTIELDAQTSSLRISGLPPDLVLGPGPSAGSSGDPIFDREVYAAPDSFGSRERAILLSAVRRGLVVRHGVLDRTFKATEVHELGALVAMATQAASTLRDGSRPWPHIALEDPALEVRLQALRRCAADQPPDWLRARLSDPEPAVVAVAAEALLPETEDLLVQVARSIRGREALRVCLERGLGDPDDLFAAAWDRGERDRGLLAMIGAHGGPRWTLALSAEPAGKAALAALRARHGAPDAGGVSLIEVDGGALSEAADSGRLAEPASEPTRAPTRGHHRGRAGLPEG